MASSPGAGGEHDEADHPAHDGVDDQVGRRSRREFPAVDGGLYDGPDGAEAGPDDVLHHVVEARRVLRCLDEYAGQHQRFGADEHVDDLLCHADQAAAQVGGVGLIAGWFGEVFEGGQQEVFLRAPAAVEGRLADGRPAGDPVEGESGPADFSVHGQGGGEDPPFDAGVGGASPPSRSLRLRPHLLESVTPEDYPFRV